MELQKNEREIKPVRTWVEGKTRSLNVLRLDSFSNYRFLDDGGTVHWVLNERLPVQDTESDIVLYTDSQLACGDVELPAALISTWGQDDQPIFEYVMNAINVAPVVG